MLCEGANLLPSKFLEDAFRDQYGRFFNAFHSFFLSGFFLLFSFHFLFHYMVPPFHDQSLIGSVPSNALFWK